MAVYKLIKLKRDYTANWTLLNPILSLGEPGYERDTGKLKIGDGVTPWVDLDYIKVDMDDVVIDPDDLADVLNNVLQGGFGIDIIYSDPSDTILIRTTGLATQSDFIALSGDVANLDSALIFRGITDPTQLNSAPTDPVPDNGDMWISNASGQIDGSWVNLSGQDIVVDQFMLYEEDANGWVLGGNAVGVDLSDYATKAELNNLQYQVNQNSNNISVNYLDIQQNIVDIINLKNSTNNQQTQIDALIQATGHIHDQDIYQIFNDLIILQDNYTALSGYSDARDDSLQQQINAISGAIPPEVDLSVISGYIAANTASGVVVLGKADQNSDDIATLSGLIDGGLDFKGYINPTVTGSAPSLPTNGDLWISDTSGVIDNGWTCIAGQDVGVNQWMIYSDDDTCWQLGPATDIDLSAYALKTELNTVSGLVDQNATDIITISGLVGSGIPSGLVEYSTGLAIRHGSTEVSVNEVSGNSVIDLTNWKIKDGHFIPNSNASFDLGNAEYKVRHLFLSDNSIYMGEGNLSATSGSTVLLWNGEPLAKITDINTIISGELAEQKLLDLQDVTSDGPVEQYAVPVYNQGTSEYKVKRLTPLEVEDTSTPPLDGYPAGSLGNELQDIKGDIQSNTILISGIAEDIVEIPDAVIFKGVTDPTVSGSAPAGPDNGDMWVSNNSGLIDGSWTGLSGEDVLENQFLLYSTGLNVWLRGGKIDVSDLSDQYLPLTGNLNPNDQKLDAVAFTSNVVTTSISGLYPSSRYIGNLTYINHPNQPLPVAAQVYGPSEFNVNRSDYSRDWKDGIDYGFDCVSILYENEDIPEAGYSWSIKVGPPSKYFPSGIANNGKPYQQNRYRDPNPKGWNPAFLAQRAAIRGQGAFEFRPYVTTASQDMTTAPYQVGFRSCPQNDIEFYKVYANEPSATPTYIGFHSDPRQQVFDNGPIGSSTKGYALHIDFRAGSDYELFQGTGHGRVYGFFADMLNKGGANVAGFIERGAEFNQLQAPTVFGADTIYGGSNPFDSANIYKPTDQIDIAQGGLRIRNAKLVQESTSGNPGQIGWDQNGLLCYTSSSWKRAPLLRFTTTVSNPTLDSVALIVDGNAKLTATANDLQAAAGYVPQTDNSLVTKGSMEDGTVKAKLPIAGVDGTVTLFGANNIFSVYNAGSESFIISADQHIGLGMTPASNVLLDGTTDQAFVYRFKSTNTGLYDGRFGTRIESTEYINFIVETVVDPQQQTYGLWGGNSGGSSPIIVGSQTADVLIRSTGPTADQFIRFDLPVISGQTGGSMVIPAGNSVPANLLIGGTGENPKSSFTICAKAGGSAVTNPQSVVWASHMDGDQYSGSAYFKLAHGDDGNNSQLSYWNIFASTPTDITDASGVYERTDYTFRIAGTVAKSTDGSAPGTVNYITCVESTDTNHCKVQINRDVEFLSAVSGINISNLDDVEFPVGPSPVSADQILRYSTLNNKWVNSNAGNAVLGSAPLGGWPVGSVGEAIANGAGAATLPISSVDNNLEISQVDTKSFGFNIQGSTAVEISQNNGSNSPTIKIGDPHSFGTPGISTYNSGTLGSSQSHYRLVSPTGTDGTGQNYTYLGVTNPTFSSAGTVLTGGTAYVASQRDMVVGAGIDINDVTRAIKFNVGNWAEVNTEMKIERNKVMTRPAYNYWACGNNYDIESSKFYLHYRGDTSKYQVGVGIPPSQAQPASDFVVGSTVSGSSTISTIQSRGFATIQYNQFRGDDGYLNISRQNQNGVISFASNEDSTGRGAENIMQFVPTTQAIRMNYNVGLNCAVGDTRLQVENPGASGTQTVYGMIVGGNMGATSIITNASCRQDQTTAAGFYSYNSVSANVTLGTLYCFRADSPNTLAGDVNSHVGFYAGQGIKHGAGNSIGFSSAVPSGESNWAFFSNTPGTQSYMKGNVGIGSNQSKPAYKLCVAAEEDDTYTLRVGNNAGGAGNIRGTTRIGIDAFGPTNTHSSVALMVNQHNTTSSFQGDLHIQMRQDQTDSLPVSKFVFTPEGNFGVNASGVSEALVALDVNSDRIAIRDEYTPNALSAGTIGEIGWDEDYIWVRTPAGWKKSALDTFNGSGSSSSVVRGSVAATGTQTDFTVTEGYTANQLDVYVNGVKMLDTTDYTASNGSTIVLATPAASGDIVQYTAYSNVSVTLATQAGTPLSSSDAGSIGDIKHSDHYIWVKTSAGWKKSPLYAFNQTPSLTVRVTQAEYDALTPDSDITYVIVG